MSQTAIPNARNFDGWIRLPIGENRMSLFTSIDFEKELWSALEYYSEVEEVGIDLLQTRGLPTPLHREIFSYLQAFVRQAKSYYTSAKALHYRSSSLLYYYSFLNLAKAYLLLREPERIMGRTNQAVVHGLKYRPSTTNTDFLLETVRVTDGIFPAFYEAQTGIAISTARNSMLNIVNLFAYCSNIGYEYASAGYGTHRILPSLSGVVTSRGAHESWSIIAIPASNELDMLLRAQGNFLNSYQEVNIDRNQLTAMFQTGVPELGRYRIFQDITPVAMIGNNHILLQAHTAKLISALTPYLSVHYFDDNADFDFTLPYQDANTATPIPINEVLAIYVSMFYLSSLVRYRPNFLESLFNRKPSWLIETFVNSAPEIFLRIMVCKIIGRDFVLRRR